MSEAYDLEYQTNLFRGQPDDEAIRLIRGYEPFALSLDPRGYCVCTSEGKDSRVVGHLMRRAGVKHFYIHNITGIDPPELIYFQRKNFQEYADMGYETHDVMYEKSMWQLMQKKLVPPLRHMRYCCEFLKERKTPQQGDAMVCTGVRKAESTKRARNRSILQHNRQHLNPYDQEEGVEVETIRSCYDNPAWDKEGLWNLNPIADWTDNLLWDYIREAKLEQCSLYNEGFHRLGCIGCPMAQKKGRERDFERWPAFKKLWLNEFAMCLEARRAKGLQIKVDDAEAWFDWWMSDAAMEAPIDEDQILFDSRYWEV